MQYQVYDTVAQKLLFDDCVAPDLETAIKRAKSTVKINANFDGVDPDKLFVCAKPKD